MNFLLSKSNILIFITQIILGFSLFNFNFTSPDISDEEKQEISTFNQTFLNYLGSESGSVSGSVIQVLIKTIENSNQTSSHKIQVFLDNSSDFSSDSIIVTNKYNIYFNYDSKGYINGATIYSVQ